MKLRIFIVIVAVVVAWVAGRSIKSGGHSIVRSVQHEIQHDAHEDNAPPPPNAPGAPDVNPANGASERRINQSYELADGASVDVHGINGPVTVEAIDGNTAEVQITSTAANAADLKDARVTIEHTKTSLVVRGKGNNGSSFWRWLQGGGSSGEVRHNVLLRLPRNVELATRGTNGRVQIAEMEGSVEVSGVNGQVEIGGARSFAEVSGVNGGVVVTVTELGDKGLRVNGINGGVEIRLGRDVNADVELNGVNGHMKVEAPNVEVKEQKRDRLRARIGTGGADIEANGINGGVRLVGV
ncbi:MAG TPA: hypothetical protein VGW12_06595 [Pyrinomonadaceae bacterium]|nr:hypothetical protein [Pyrinomonadaceae bacterium]